MKNLFCTFLLLSSGLLSFSQADIPRESMIDKQDFTKPEKSQIKTTPVWEVTFEEETPIWTFGSIVGSKTWYVGDTTPTNGYLYQGNPMPPLWFYMGQRYVKDFSVSGNSFAYIDGISDYLGLIPPAAYESFIQFDNIDLSSLQNSKMSFYQNYKKFSYDYCYIDFSNDGGSTWETVSINSEIENNQFAPTYCELMIPQTMALSSNVSIRFRWKNTYSSSQNAGYGWELDDISIVENPDCDMRVLDGRVNFFANCNYSEPGNEQYFHCSSHFGKIPANTFDTDLATIWFNVIVKNMGNQEVNPIVNVTVFDPEMTEVFNYTSTSETELMPVEGIDTVDLITVGFYPGINPTIGLYTIEMSVSAEGQTDGFPENNSITSYFYITDSVYSRALNEPDEERGVCDFYSGGLDGDMLGSTFEFFECTEISSIDVYIGETSTPGTGIVAHVLAYDQSISDFAFLYSSEMMILEEAELGTWKNFEFMDPAIITLPEGEEFTNVIVALEFYYIEEGNVIRLGFDNDVHSSMHGTYFFMASEYTWAYGGWTNSSSICINLNTSTAQFVCPADTAICYNNGLYNLATGSFLNCNFSGTGVEGNVFNPMVAGVGAHTISCLSSQLNCEFTITVMGIPEIAQLVTNPENGVYNSGNFGEILIPSTEPEILYGLNLQGNPIIDPILGNGFQISLGDDFAQGTYQVVATNSFGCSVLGEIVSLLENSGTSKIAVSSLIDNNTFLPDYNDVAITLYKQVDEGGTLVTSIYDQIFPTSEELVVFDNLDPAVYFVASTVVFYEEGIIYDNVFYDQALIFDDAAAITISDQDVVLITILHNSDGVVEGSNQGGGTVGEQPEGKSLNPLEGKAVILKNSDLNEIIDVAITDETGHYNFPAIPDNTNIQIFVTMPEYPVWTAYSCETQTGQSLIIDFIASGNSVYPVSAKVPEQIFVQQRFNVFPNPSADKIKIESDLACKEVKIFNLQGKLVMTEKSALITTIDVSHLSVGSYILVGIDESNNVGIAKFVKE